MPAYRLEGPSGPTALARTVRDGVADVLGDDVLPNERLDRRIALEVIDHVMTHPAAEVKAASIGSRLQLDARTVNRYLDVAESRFVTYELANLRPPGKGSPRTTAKAYPVDTALSAAHLLTDSRRWSSEGVRGPLFEAHVVQQIKAHAGWASSPVALRHSRVTINGRTDEVDLVLETDDGLVAIEIKAREGARADDFSGIRRFALREADRFHRGFVITAGGSVASFGDGLWALPVEALYDEAGFWEVDPAPEHAPAPGRLGSGRVPVDIPGESEARVFMSYAHKDQESAVAGDLRLFAQDVMDAVETLHDVEVSLFIDARDGLWGETLWDRLDEELRSSTFLLPFITPSYLKSQACRSEFTRFLDAADRQGSSQLVPPLIWITPPRRREDAAGSDIIMSRVRDLRYLDVSGARLVDRGSEDYRRLVSEVADQLARVIEVRESGGMSMVRNGSDDPSGDIPAEGEAGLDEMVAELEAVFLDIEPAVHGYVSALESVGQELQKSLAKLPEDPARWGAMMRVARKDLARPSGNLERASAELNELWGHFTALTGSMLRLGRDAGESAPRGLADEVSSVADALMDLDLEELDTTAVQMPRISSQLAPVSRSVRQAIRAVRSMEQSARSLAEEIRRWEEDRPD